MKVKACKSKQIPLALPIIDEPFSTALAATFFVVSSVLAMVSTMKCNK